MTISIILFLIGLVGWIYLIATGYDKVSAVFIGGIMLLLYTVVVVPIPIITTGVHLEIGRGEHTGYVTAVQKQGIFFKTGRAYLKSDVQSSQEDQYCVTDEKVFEQLQVIAKENKKVTLKYFSWLANGIKNCEGESDIIYEVIQ